MDGVKLVLEELHDGESDLVEELRRVAFRHATDSEVRYGASDMARWSEDHVRRLAQAGNRFGMDLGETVDGGGSKVVQKVRETTAKAMGRRSEPALVLLRDLRDLHLSATRNLLDWEVLSQTAKALRDKELLGLAESCKEQTSRQTKWAETLIKELAPQTITSMSADEAGEG